MEKQREIKGTEEQKEQFLALSREVYPLIEQIREKLNGSTFGGAARISIGEDGYMEFQPYDCGWRLVQYRMDKKPSITYEYQERMEMGGIE